MKDRGAARYAVVEVSPVTEETLATALNDRAAAGWSFESLHFVMREGSHRPAMAFLFFTGGEGGAKGAARGARGARR